MIVIFDLDHTLMNSEKFKGQLPRIFELSRQNFQRSKEKYFIERQDFYSPIKHAEFLYDSQEISKKQLTFIKKSLKLLAKDANSYLFSDADLILKNLRQRNNYLLLLSHGDRNWQRLKIKGLHIRKYFDRIIITDKKKTAALKFLKNKKNDILIINDNALENKEMIEFLGRGRAILIRGIHSNDIKHNHKSYSLKQATNIIMNKF